MPVVETLSAVKSNLLLNNGTTTTGAIKTISQSIGTLGTNWDADKAFAIMEAAADIFTKQVVDVNAVKTYKLSSGS